MVTYLKPQYDSRKSFGNKALVITTDTVIKLQSYTTIVAELNKQDDTIKINGYYSPITARHINEFLRQNGFKSLTKQEMEVKPILKRL